MQTATESSTDLIDGSIDEVAPEVFATMLDWERPAAISKKVSLVPESFIIC
jgi:hypothetical protein